MIALNTMQTIASGLEMRLKTVNGLRSAFSGFAKIANETIERIKETILKYDAARKFNPIIAKINAVNEFLFKSKVSLKANPIFLGMPLVSF